DFSVAIFVALGQGSDGREGVATLFHHQLDPGVTGARGRRRAHNGDLQVRQIRVDVGPALVRVRDDLAVHLYLSGKRLEELRAGDIDRLAVERDCKRDAVETELDLGDILDTVGLAVFPLRGLHGTRGAGDVGMLDADAATEQP